MARISLAPTLLLAMPQLEDPHFHRSVVLLCREEDDGAMGLIVNRRTDTAVSTVVDFDLELASDNGSVVWMGGPVEPHRGWLLLGYDPGSPDALEVADGLYLSASMTVLRSMVEERWHPTSRFLLGYARGGGGQLQAELAASAWLSIDASHDLIFRTPAEDMWETAIRSLGINPFSLQTGGGMH